MDRASHIPGLWRWNALRVAALTVLISGCGNLTAGGLSEADVTVSGDAPDPVPTAARAVVGSGPLLQDDEEEPDEAEGQLEAHFELFLRTVSGSEIPLSDDDIQVRVDIQGIEESTPVRRSIPAGRYTALRILFNDIDVEVDAGLVIDGTPITGLVDVDFEAEDLEVLRSLDLNLGDGERVELLVDLNAQTWLQAVDPVLQTVDETFFADAITVSVR